MKKYIFSILFFIGCFFLSLSMNTSDVEAVINVYSVTQSNTGNSRYIKVGLEGLNSTTTEIRINEIVYCVDDTQDGCNKYELMNAAGDDYVTYYFKILDPDSPSVYPAHGEGSMVLDYYIKANSDGLKYFYITTVQSAFSNYGFFEWELSTLDERIIINPNANGTPMNVYDGVQYTSVRQINLNVELFASEKSTYSGTIRVCENVVVRGLEVDDNCSEYVLGEDDLKYFIMSFGDGVKKVRIYLLKNEASQSPLMIERELYLHTIGPDISIEGGTWVFVKSGEKYVVQNATCSDAVFKNDECEVTNDVNDVRINYDSDNYQFITYQATDRLGNIKTMTVKVKVEQKAANNSNYLYFIVAGAVMLITFLILGWILIKNREKKKKMSYI